MLFKDKAEAIAYAVAHMEVMYATNNRAYQAKRDIKCEGDVNHSFGCAQPNISVAYKIMNTAKAGWAVAAILGDFHLGEGKIRVCLPYDAKKKTVRRNWGVGSGKKGSWNNTRIQWEVLEPAGHTYAGGTMIGYDAEKNRGYFERMWKLLVAWNVYVADMMGFTAATINDHAESYKAGMGGNHADMGQWLPKHGKSMDALRAEVTAILTAPAYTGNDADNGKEETEMNEERIKALVQDQVQAEVTAAIQAEREKGKYATLADVPEDYKPAVEKLLTTLHVMSGYNGGADGKVETVEDNNILVDETFCRVFVLLDRLGLLDLDDLAAKVADLTAQKKQ